MWDKPFGFYFLLFIILTLFFKFYAIIYGFLPAIATSCVLAYLTTPLYIRLTRFIKFRSLSALIVIFCIFILILVPMTFLVLIVQDQFQEVFTPDIINQARESISNLDEFVFKYLHRHIVFESFNDFMPRMMSGLQDFLTSFGPKMIFSVTRMVLNAFVALFIMYYLLLNGKLVIATLRYYGPLSEKNMTLLLGEIAKETRTLILGQFLIAVVQGTLTTIGLLFFGVSGFILWGVFSAITSLIPVMGAGIIWFPAVVILLLRGEYFNGIGLLLWGALIVSTSDNILRPKLTNLLGKIHPVTVLLGVFIGIKEWGLIGIVLGPLIITTLIILIRMFREQFLDEQSE